MGTAAMEGPLWGARARDWVELQEPSWRPVYASVLDAIRVREGHEVLDVGCGSGGALRLVRERGECDFAYADPATAWRARRGNSWTR